MRKKNIIILVVTLLVVDQIVKFWIKTHMTIDQSFTVFPEWFFIRFIENPGAAYGMQIGGEYGKLALSLFRIAAISVGIWYVGKLVKRKTTTGVMLGVSLILAGAIGNVIDSAFYGMIFSESTFTTTASFLPEAGGYAGFLHGKVVDMLYFPIIESVYPTWMPWVGGDPFIFFSPIFNLADSYISVGVIYLLLFERKHLA